MRVGGTDTRPIKVIITEHRAAQERVLETLEKAREKQVEIDDPVKMKDCARCIAIRAMMQKQIDQGREREEKLRKASDEMAKVFSDLNEQLERAKGERDTLEANSLERMDGLMEQIERQEVEVKRQKALVAFADRDLTTALDQRDEARAEVERLRDVESKMITVSSEKTRAVKMREKFNTRYADEHAQNAELRVRLGRVETRLDELITDMHDESNKLVSSDIWGTELEDCRAILAEGE